MSLSCPCLAPRQAPRWLQLLGLVAAGAVVASLANPWLPPRPSMARWLVDLSAHHLWLSVPLAVLLGLLLLRQRAHAIAWPILVCSVLGATRLGLSVTPTVMAAPPGLDRTVASANLLWTNPAPDRLLHWLHTRPAQVVALQEVPAAWFPLLAALPEYPYQVLEPGPQGDGMALLSQVPLTEQPAQRLGSGAPFLQATVWWPGQATTVMVAHPRPPLTPQLYATQVARLRHLGDALRATSVPAIVAGDFNATPWSTGYVLLRERGLTAAPRALPTWPVWPGPAWLPLDHVFTSAHWLPVAAERGPDLGSDHYPVVVTLRWYRPSGG